MSVQWTEIVYKMTTFLRFAKILKEDFDINGSKFLKRPNEVNLRFLDFKPIRIGENLDSGELQLTINSRFLSRYTSVSRIKIKSEESNWFNINLLVVHNFI